MELRKIIKFGRATYSITLPKQWITEQNIKKGDVVWIERMPAGRLMVSPRASEAEESKVKTIEVDANNKTPLAIYREVISYYVKNYTIINISGDVKGKIKDLREYLRDLMGLEIMEVGPQKIVTKTFLDVSQTNIDQTLKRLFYIIKSMSDDFKILIHKGGKAEEIKEMDVEVNRNTFFTMKHLFKALEKPEIAGKMGLSRKDILYTWELVKLLEAIADRIKKMSSLYEKKEVLVKAQAKKDFVVLYEKLEKNFYTTMEKYFKKSKENIHDLFLENTKNGELCEEFIRKYTMAWTPVFIDQLTDIKTYTREIAHIILDFD